jgi:hypothetical protein
LSPPSFTSDRLTAAQAMRRPLLARIVGPSREGMVECLAIDAAAPPAAAGIVSVRHHQDILLVAFSAESGKSTFSEIGS